MQKHGYRIKQIKMGEIKQESPEKQTYRPSPEEIIHRFSRSGFGSVDVSPSMKRKSFQQFLEFMDTTASHSIDIANQKIKRKKYVREQMIISYDHMIQPIHRRTKTFEPEPYRITYQKIEKPIISRTKIYNKRLEKVKKQSKVEPEQVQIKSNSSPLLLKKIQIKNKFKQNMQNFDCRPWTRRAQREQTQQNIPLKSP